MLQMSQDERISRSHVEFIDDEIMNHKDYATFFSNQFNSNQQQQEQQQMEQQDQQQQEVEINVTRTIK